MTSKDDQHPALASDLYALDTDELVLIVAGAHTLAELHDRPVANTLRDSLAAALERNPTDDDAPTPQVLVCSDIWYLNNDELRARPTISIGGPGVNALSAYLIDKLPTVFAIDGVLSVQMDLDAHEPIACCWGAERATSGHPTGTAAAAAAFTERYIDHFAKLAAV